MHDPGGAVRVFVQLEGCRALRAERALVVRAARIPFDIDDLAALHVNQGRAAHRAERADAWHRGAVPDAQFLSPGARGGEAEPEADDAPERRAGAGATRIPQKFTA